ncbi:MAG: cation diffusion facilitator family transporter, partial [Bacteroidales bacterium]
MQNIDQIKQKVQRGIVTVSVLLLVGKFLAYFLTNSVGVLTDAMESIVNVVAGFISLYSLNMASRPKDKSHPFGHGKAELLSASIEGLLIMFAGGLIIFEGI